MHRIYFLISANTPNNFEQQSAIFDKKLSYCTGTVQCSMSAEILSTAAQLYEKSHLNRLAVSLERLSLKSSNFVDK